MRRLVLLARIAPDLFATGRELACFFKQVLYAQIIIMGCS